jgi:hypothetical protein
MREVARPEGDAGLVVRVSSVPLGAPLVVAPEDVAVIERGGEAIVSIGPGQHELTAAGIPEIAEMAFGDVLDAELWFVRTAPLFGVKVGGPAGEIVDAASGIYLRPRFFAEVAVAVADPSRLVAALVTGGLPDEGGALLAFVRTHVLEAARQTLRAVCASGSGNLGDLENLLPQVLEQIPLNLADLDGLGLSIGAFQNVTLTLSAEEASALVTARLGGAASRVRAIHCSRCGAQARGAYCTQCGSPVDRTG